jgi:metal-dependent hydrolase (beta-lactamase superfamily II)
MKLTVLVDNFVINDAYFLGEPGFSVHIQSGDTSVLFDLGET